MHHPANGPCMDKWVAVEGHHPSRSIGDPNAKLLNLGTQGSGRNPKSFDSFSLRGICDVGDEGVDLATGGRSRPLPGLGGWDLGRSNRVPGLTDRSGFKGAKTLNRAPDHCCKFSLSPTWIPTFLPPRSTIKPPLMVSRPRTFDIRMRLSSFIPQLALEALHQLSSLSLKRMLRRTTKRC